MKIRILSFLNKGYVQKLRDVKKNFTKTIK